MFVSPEVQQVNKTEMTNLELLKQNETTNLQKYIKPIRKKSLIILLKSTCFCVK